MDTSRLKSLIENLIQSENEFKIQKILGNLENSLSTLVSSPQAADVQVAVSEQFDELLLRARRLSNRWEPAQLEDLDEIGALDFFGESFVEAIQGSTPSSSLTPAVVQKHFHQLKEARHQYIELLKSSDQDLSRLNITAEPLVEGTAEIGFRIPRQLFDGELEGLIEELRVLRRIMRAFSEVTLGAAEPIEVKQISTTDPLFFFGLAPFTVVAIGRAVTWALSNWKQVEEIRKLRAETEKLQAHSEKEIEEFFDSKIKRMIDKAIDRKAKELVGSEDPKQRKAEQYIDLKWALNSLFARIERGMTVEMRFLPPPAEGEEDEAATTHREAFTEMAEIAPQLSFPEPEGTPILQLPSRKPPSEEEPSEERPKASKRQNKSEGDG
jgi:nucleoside-triphosphatase THEP1